MGHGRWSSSYASTLGESAAVAAACCATRLRRVKHAGAIFSWTLVQWSGCGRGARREHGGLWQTGVGHEDAVHLRTSQRRLEARADGVLDAGEAAGPFRSQAPVTIAIRVGCRSALLARAAVQGEILRRPGLRLHRIPRRLRGLEAVGRDDGGAAGGDRWATAHSRASAYVVRVCYTINHVHTLFQVSVSCALQTGHQKLFTSFSKTPGEPQGMYWSPASRRRALGLPACGPHA